MDAIATLAAHPTGGIDVLAELVLRECFALRERLDLRHPHITAAVKLADIALRRPVPAYEWEPVQAGLTQIRLADIEPLRTQQACFAYALAEFLLALKSRRAHSMELERILCRLSGVAYLLQRLRGMQDGAEER